MSIRATSCFLALFLLSAPAFSSGVSPYLPLNIDPDMDAMIQRMLMLAQKPVLTRPLAAATVLDALQTSCSRDPETCGQVRRYLHRYMGTFDVTDASVEVAASGGANHPIPNRYGLSTESPWDAAVRAYYQPFDHALVSLGAVAYQGEINPTGSMLSIGFSRAQLDIGYREHWWSPMSDSAMLISTNGPTMPSVTLSNYAPLTRFGLRYEAFLALMDHSDTISYGGEQTAGRPRLAGGHVSMEPATGWAIGFNRLMQFGGGTRPGSLNDLFRAFFNPSKYDNSNPNLTTDEEFGNQVASITSQMLFPGRVPYSVYFEYAGEDTSASKSYLLGNSALSAGIHFSRLWDRFDLTYEISEWQNDWYTHHLYGDGLTSKHRVLGHWGGDDRVFGIGPGARTQMLSVGWLPPFGGRVETRVRTIANQTYYTPDLKHGYDGSVSYSRPFLGLMVGAEAYSGRDVFGEHFSRFAAFVRYAGDTAPIGTSGGEPLSVASSEGSETFIQAGAASNSVNINLDGTAHSTVSNVGAHFAVGARRPVSDRSDLGARLELDDVDGHMLMSVRALDYRYRFRSPLALSVFIGASRYDLATPAYGMYLGAGLEWRDIAPGWDVGVDLRDATKVARDHLLPDDPKSAVRPDSFYNVRSLSLVITKRF